MSTTAEECENPGRDMPRGILWSLAICTVVYVATTAVVTDRFATPSCRAKQTRGAYVFERYHLTKLAGMVSFGAVIATAASLLVYQVGQPRDDRP